MNGDTALQSRFSMLEQLSENIAGRINCMVLARVTNAYPDRRQIDAQPLNRMPDGTDRAQILNVPFVLMRGGQSFISMPVGVGDICLLIFCDHCIDNAIKLSETSMESHRNLHEINDAIAIVGIFPLDGMIPMEGFVKISDRELIAMDAPSVACSGSASAASLHAGNGWSGSFATADNKSVSVSDGIVTGVS
jgi:hypothetical protein